MRPSCFIAAGAGDRVVGVLATSDWPPEALAQAESRRFARARPRAHPAARPGSGRHVAFRGAGAGRRAHGARRAGLHRESRDDRRHRAGPRAAGNARRNVAGGGGARPPNSARDWRGSRIATVEPGRCACSTRSGTCRSYTIGGKHLISQALRVCGGENVFASLPLPAPRRERGGGAGRQPDAIIAGADRAVRPAWLDEWKRWPTLPAVARRQSFHRRRESPAPVGAAVHRRRRSALRDALRGAFRRALKIARTGAPARGPCPPAGSSSLDRQEGPRRAVAHGDEPVSEERR